MVQVKLPPVGPAGAAALICVKVTYGALAYSRRTAGRFPTADQPIVRVEPTSHCSPPFGLVRVRAARILKVASEVSTASGSAASEIRTFAFTDTVSETTQT